MTEEQTHTPTAVINTITQSVNDNDLTKLAAAAGKLTTRQLVSTLERLSARQRAVAYRLLPKQRALEVFDALQPALQGELVEALQDAEVAALFAELNPDDRVWLMDELPATVAQRLLRGLPERDRQLTAEVLGYPQDSIGRRASPEVVATHPELTAAETLRRLRLRVDDAETVYTLPVVDHERRVVGVVSLRDLIGAEDDVLIESLMQEAHTAVATEDAEIAARRCTDLELLALPVVDSESRLVGILTIDDAVRILQHEESEDVARQGGVEPLNRPYLATPVLTLVRSRVVWLLVLALGATLHCPGSLGVRGDTRAVDRAGAVRAAADRHRRQHGQPSGDHRHSRARARRRASTRRREGAYPRNARGCPARAHVGNARVRHHERDL